MAEAGVEISKRLERARRFALRNARDLRQLDRRRLRRKLRVLFRVHLRRTLRLVVSLVPGVPLALFMRAIRPIVLIRLGTINTTRLGHLAMDVEMATAEREFGVNTDHPRTVDLWYPWGVGYEVANRQLLRMWKRSVRVLPAVLLEGAYQLNAVLPGGQVHTIPYRRGNESPSNFQDVHGVLARSRPHVSFTDDEVREAERGLRELNIAPEDRLIGLHVRTSAYLKRQLGPASSGTHDFRDADIHNFLDALEWLVESGFRVIRLGTEDDGPMRECRGVIDYATLGVRSELLDVFIPSRVDFLISVLSGPTHLAQIFRRPILLTNVVPLSTMMLSAPRSLFIPKRIESSFGSTVTLSELGKAGLLAAADSRVYAERGLRVVENTPEEIREACREMDARLRGDWVDSDADEEFQQEFLRLIPEFLKTGHGGGRLASTYLRRHGWIRS